jgi:ABC-type cobalamin transport system ATPase subunit
MKLSELIARLAEMLEMHGDIDVGLGDSIDAAEVIAVEYHEAYEAVLIR